MTAVQLDPDRGVARFNPARGVARVIRAGALGSASLLLAAGAHLVGGGMLPSAGVLLVVAVLVGLTAVTLTQRRCRLPLVLAVLGVQQVLLHYLFAVAGAATLDAACLTSSPGHHAVAHGCWSMTPGSMTPGSVTVGSMAGDHLGWMMLAAHAGAVLLTAALLARGEAGLWRLADRIVTAASTQLTSWSTPVRTLTTSRQTFALPAVSYAPAAPRGPPVL